MTRLWKSKARPATPLLRTLTFISLLLALASTVWAVPASPDLGRLRQPSGESFEARLWGDEWLHGYETVDGFAIVQDAATDYWHFATLGASGELEARPERPGIETAPAELERHLRPLPTSESVE